MEPIHDRVRRQSQPGRLIEPVGAARAANPVPSPESPILRVGTQVRARSGVSQIRVTRSGESKIPGPFEGFGSQGFAAVSRYARNPKRAATSSQTRGRVSRDGERECGILAGQNFPQGFFRPSKQARGSRA